MKNLIKVLIGLALFLSIWQVFNFTMANLITDFFLRQMVGSLISAFSVFIIVQLEHDRTKP
jgi:hypothetical protein